MGGFLYLLERILLECFEVFLYLFEGILLEGFLFDLFARIPLEYFDEFLYLCERKNESPKELSMQEPRNFRGREQRVFPSKVETARFGIIDTE